MPVEQIKDTMNLWGFLSQGWPYLGALSVVWLTHILARHREKKGLEDKAAHDLILAEKNRLYDQEKADIKQASELRFIGSQLIFILESFAVKCADVAVDKGKRKENNNRKGQVVIIPAAEIPDISFAGVEGDWRALRSWDMFRIMELPVMLLDAHTNISNRSESLLKGPDSAEILRIRASYISPLGLRASSLARRIRRQCGFPESPLSEGPHSATQVLLKERKRHVKRVLSELDNLDI
ncbi:hypothetical protein ROL70_20320 [Cronobacter sakazakii]|uniref:hypothetical protein n=1 Tax=Cronobacter sakazakii TaxID=28141 RepID=UPI0009787DAE|nr:hypothetical protein [Cronobacter sakazakii]MDT3587323.1 hypothetical protein [Cronobacter sakazakii]